MAPVHPSALAQALSTFLVLDPKKSMRWPTVTSFLSELPVVCHPHYCPPLEVCAGPGGGKSVSVLVHGVNTWPSLSDNDWETPVAVPSHFLSFLIVRDHCR